MYLRRSVPHLQHSPIKFNFNFKFKFQSNNFNFKYHKRFIMSISNSVPAPLKQVEVKLSEAENPIGNQQRVFNPRSNQAKRKRTPHRKPPRTNHDPTTPLGVLTEFEIPNMLHDHHEKICALLDFPVDTTEIFTIKDVLNPVRDIINDVGVLDAYNWREIRNVEVLCMSSKGDGLAVIKAPTYETVLKCQEAAHEREKKAIEEAQAAIGETEVTETTEKEDEDTEPVNEDGKKRRKLPSTEPYRRTVIAENLPKIQVVTIPFSFPGDIVNIKVYHTNSHYVDAEIIDFTKLSPLRSEIQEKLLAGETPVEKETDEVINPKESPCAYFGICSGCQYQPISYSNQLLIKKEVVENAYKHFCKDSVAWEGKVLDTVASPLKYGYRTKLTPHYDVPRSGNKGLSIPRLGFGWRGKGSWLGIVGKDEKITAEDAENQGEFINKDLTLEHDDSLKAGMRKRAVRPYFGDVLDIEDCIIGTDIVRKGFVQERRKLKETWNKGEKSKKGVTVLLRENNTILEEGRTSDDVDELKDIPDDEKIIVEIPGVEGKVVKTCVTENQKVISDLVDTGLGRVLRFDFIANEFFQNNNSILPLVIKYVLTNLGEEMEYLVDAYCGSGLFSVAIASDEKNRVKKVLGVEISERAVTFAKKNAELNKISNEHCDFIQGKAEKLFEHINFPKETTGVILDPPRKGCDDVFLKQLSDFEPNRIVYVSCNVHSQARDVKYFLNETANGSKYELESIRGFDFFPQTHHVESVAVLVHKK